MIAPVSACTGVNLKILLKWLYMAKDQLLPYLHLLKAEDTTAFTADETVATSYWELRVSPRDHRGDGVSHLDTSVLPLQPDETYLDL